MNLKNQTPLKKYLKDNKIKVADAAKALGIYLQAFYRILRGEVRPSTKTAQRIFEYVKGEIPLEIIRPPLDRYHCPYCTRWIKPYLKARIGKKSKEDKELKKDKAKKPKVSREKKVKNLLDL